MRDWFATEVEGIVTLITDTVNQIKPMSPVWRDKARRHLEQLAMPHWALGRLMDLAEDLCSITGRIPPATSRKAIVIMAADHGVCKEQVSKYPVDVTCQMVHSFVEGRAGINALAALNHVQVHVVDMGVCGDLTELLENQVIISRSISKGTENIAKAPAMSQSQAIQSIEAGIQIATELSESIDVFGIGEMGIGNTTISTAIASVITGQPVEVLTGHGTGIDHKQFQNKVHVIKTALRLHQPDPYDAIDILSKVGGFELGAIAGFIIGVSSLRKPVLIDGVISSAGALLAQLLSPTCCDYIIASHKSVEPGHKYILDKLNKAALLELNLRLGEGTGAALAMNLVEAASRIMTGIGTFEDLHVSRAIK